MDNFKQEKHVRARLETEALLAVQQGDYSRFQELVEAYQGKVMNLIGRQVGDMALAEDLTQEVFLRAFRGLRGFRAESSFSTWLFRIALNVSNSYFSSRSYKQRRRSYAIDQRQHENVAEARPPDESDNDQQKEALREAIAALNQRLRETVILCALEGKPYEEAAGILGVPVGTVRSRLNRARGILREKLMGTVEHGGA